MYVYSTNVRFEDALDADVDMSIRMNGLEASAFMNTVQKGIIDEKKLAEALTGEALKKSSSTRKPRFGGAFFIDGKYVYIKNIIVNKPAVIVFWSDGTKTKAVCDEKDTFDPNFGLTLATLKKFAGSEATSKLFEDWGLDSKEEKVSISLKDLRKKEKEIK